LRIENESRRKAAPLCSYEFFTTLALFLCDFVVQKTDLCVAKRRSLCPLYHLPDLLCFFAPLWFK